MASFSKLLIAGTLLLSGGLSPLVMAAEVAIAQTTIAQTDTRTQAQQLFDEGMQLFQQGTAESYQQAITKWEQALPLWRKLEDKAQEAFINLALGKWMVQQGVRS
ncbi:MULTISPECIES: hypothetical protein [unclassified Microcystis]|jgi:hypothetical protein|uniref:Tetratricopeptide repeat protein n=1 Tax=Microcystis aeruginosa G11-04 TaxID=2685956 RepID=A0A966L448_MICAE|nr:MULTISPECIES: hypothetical protein [unclassified Microcystis]MCA2765269.1 hypothetical protein [Microcystis sp. M151S2]MCU7245087.1 hypothetical protein [Microcystis aeruginosa WS75]NCR20341.1 hypothetical protein [Microcystis aeruginosa LL13-03]NCR29218.1 hypothetical protein [Microcystis aeruginosa LE13-04]NCR67003.1 hypothetical protein [Microcystis aeruginosa LL11-07]NCS41895.1 hypothetical protein [Microcystis aeruginosa BS13-10]NCS45785.1 hypothetical protein [Microcystis aeruginosa